MRARLARLGSARLVFTASAAGILVLGGLTVSPVAQDDGPRADGQASGRVETANVDTGEIHALKVQGNVYMLVGGGGNITVQVGDEGVLFVDTGVAQATDKIVAAVRRITDKPIRYIINTHVHADHVGGNEKIARLGFIIAGGNMGAGANTGAAILAHEHVLNRMSAPTGSKADMPFGAWPTDTYFTARKELFFNGEPIEILHVPNAHTDGDSIVFFRHSDVISAGDLFLTTTYPFIDEPRGGNIQGIISGLNRMLDIAIPKEKQEGGTYLIPGHGRLCDEADLLEYRDMLTIIRDRIQDMVGRGMTLEQVKAARPTLDYDGRYGATSGAWTTDQFIAAVYHNLSQKTDNKSGLQK